MVFSSRRRFNQIFKPDLLKSFPKLSGAKSFSAATADNLTDGIFFIWCYDLSSNNDGSDGGASGRATAFCLCRLGSNPTTDLGFLFRIAVRLVSLVVGLFLRVCN